MKKWFINNYGKLIIALLVVLSFVLGILTLFGIGFQFSATDQDGIKHVVNFNWLTIKQELGGWTNWYIMDMIGLIFISVSVALSLICLLIPKSYYKTWIYIALLFSLVGSILVLTGAIEGFNFYKNFFAIKSATINKNFEIGSIISQSFAIIIPIATSGTLLFQKQNNAK